MESAPLASTGAPRTLHIVLNSVVEDSRVLKCGWSLGNAGWDVLILGATSQPFEDQLTIGYATIRRVSFKPVVTQDFIAKVLRRLRYYKRRLEAHFLPKRKPAVPNFSRAIKVATPIALEFLPDVIHAHDYTALPIAGALIDVLKEQGHVAHLVYDAHEYVPGVAHLTKPIAKVYTTQERRYASRASAILSVSEGMNELLMPHLGIATAPDIVANDPLVEGQLSSQRNLRADCKLSADVPLLVYSGAVAPQRGVGDVLEALRRAPEFHLALIANPANATVVKYCEEYADLGDRFHVLPYVPNAELVSYLSTADIGLIPIHHKLNHEISLITKFGEYMQARLPIISSDVRTMSAEVRRLGIGEVFVAQDIDDFIRAARAIMSNKSSYVDRYTPEILSERSWERQAENLLSIYNRIAGVTPTPRLHKPFQII